MTRALVSRGIAPVDWATTLNWKDPEYAPIYEERQRRLITLRENPQMLPGVRDHYSQNPADFINDWGVTFDPRNADVDKPTIVPFILTPKQREWITWVLERWHTRSRGINEKSRDMGVTWLAIALACTLCLFRYGIVIGFGSRKAEYVDEIGTMKPILPKGRMFLEYLPEEFRGAWEGWRDAPLMHINFPETGSIITGEAGDSIGRGDRTTLYFVDEAMHHPKARLIEASLSNTTRCRIDMSSVNGMNNPIAQKRWQWNDERVFIFDWRDDPRKDDAWYEAQLRDTDPLVVAQEVDRDYSASVSGIVIPGHWVRSCIDACEKLGITPTGAHRGCLDVADEGVDKNAFGEFLGVQVEWLDQWSGRGSDLAETAGRAIGNCDRLGLTHFRYDADGLGAGIRGDVRVINERRASINARIIQAEAWRGSEAVADPEAVVEGMTRMDGTDRGRKNKDYFFNRKAQGWGALRRRIEKTHNWITKGLAAHPDEILSISSKCPLYLHLVAELSQPTWGENTVGKMVVNKKPNGMPSPNLADLVMMNYAPGEGARVVVTPDLMKRVMAMPRRRRY